MRMEQRSTKSRLKDGQNGRRGEKGFEKVKLLITQMTNLFSENAESFKKR